MKKILFVSLIALSLVMTGCKKDNKKALEFKEDYEELNGTTNSRGVEHRTITISKDNKFVEVTPSEILKKIENKETFYVYFGSRLCPWCRSVIEKADEISRNRKISKIYYVDVWDDQGVEIFRDKYEVIDKELKQTFKGAKEYKKILNSIDQNLLRDYVITNSDGSTIEVGEKRIYAPNFVYFEKGKGIRLTNGKSEKQTDAREKLTKEMLKDEEKVFNEFFK